MSDLELEEHLEKSLSGLTRSVLDTACSEMEMEMSNLHTNELPNEEETASEEEREDYFRKIRQEEYIQLIENAERERKMSEQVPHKKDGNGGNTTDVDIAVKEERTEGQEEQARHQLGEESKGDRFSQTTTDETAGAQERIAVFQAVRDAEYKKLLEAVKRDFKKKEQKEQGTKMALTEEKCDAFFNVAVDNFTGIYTKQPLKQNDNNQQPSTSADETYGLFNKPSPKGLSSVSDTSADAPENRQFNDETDLTKKECTTTENKMPFGRSISDVGINRQKSTKHLILKIFKRSKSLSLFRKDLSTQTRDSEEKTVVKEDTIIKKLEIPDWDEDHFVEPPKPTLKPYFNNTEEEEPMKSEVVYAEEETSSGNVFTRATRRFRKWLRSLSCCCCESDIESDIVVSPCKVV